MSAFDGLIGQAHVVEVLRAAARGVGMTHAWLFTGPPGSGRSVAARAFAAALQCTAEEPGCGVCAGCHTVLAGTHADVEIVTPQGLSLGVKEARELVGRAALAPAGRRWQVMVIEDADRLTEGAANVLLKAIEEPTARTVWLLCVPSAEDLVVTIRSRCRVAALRTPHTDAIAQMLRDRDGVDDRTARLAAQMSGGHVGRARRLAIDKDARDRRAAVLLIPSRLSDVGACVTVADELVKAINVEAAEIVADLDESEVVALKEAFGEGGSATGLGRGQSGASITRGASRAAASALKDLEVRQKSRATRTSRDAFDRTLIDLAGFYRDVLVLQLGAGVELANVDQEARIRELAANSTPESTLRRLDGILACREALSANVNQLLALESLMLKLRAG